MVSAEDAALVGASSSPAMGAEGASSSADAHAASDAAAASDAYFTGPVPDSAVPVVADAPIGWASVSGMGLDGTTGGASGQIVQVKSREDFVKYVSAALPYVIEISGTIELREGPASDGASDPNDGRVKIASNKTVRGVGTHPTLRGTLDIKDAQNIIVQNLFVEQPVIDGIALRRSHHVWIDHVDISDASDGNLDVTDQSDYVTVSWSKFWYRDASKPHRFSNLIGADDSILEDCGHLRVTYHHNWWADNVFERMPRTRYGDIHVFNNFYSAKGNSYCIQAGHEASLLVESNSFLDVNKPYIIEPSGTLVRRGNAYLRTAPGYADTDDGGSAPAIADAAATTDAADSTDAAPADENDADRSETSACSVVRGPFTPPYAYPLDRSGDIAAIVTTYAGPR
jgi:pectate lyase